MALEKGISKSNDTSYVPLSPQFFHKEVINKNSGRMCIEDLLDAPIVISTRSDGNILKKGDEQMRPQSQGVSNPGRRIKMFNKSGLEMDT